MVVQCDIFKEGGKWYTGGFVEIEALPWEGDKVLRAFFKVQALLADQAFKNENWYLVMTDVPESANDVNYRMTYNRLYLPEKIKEIAREVYKQRGTGEKEVD